MRKKKEPKPLTWLDLKKIINRIPADKLKYPITVWSARHDETSFSVINVRALEENYREDGDGVSSASALKDVVKVSKASGEDWHPIIFYKGTRILIID